jgi:Fe-S cluster biogenesis protein NfuA
MNVINTSFLTFLISQIATTQAFTTAPISKTFVVSSSSSPVTTLYETAEDEQVISPFEEGSGGSSDKEQLELTWENVDLVLDDMRPYLIQDGGNVKIDEIDGPVVRLQLEGACGTCPSSTQTMKMGLERGLRERIPEIQEVIQAMPEGPALTSEEIDVVLDGVRPFLSVAGGTINCESIEGESSIQPVINLKMEGSSASLNSVKLEISQRLQRHFMLAGLKVEWL